MSSYVAASPWSLPGFKRNFYTSGGRLKAAFESPEPLSDEDDSDRVVIVRNLTVLVRLLLWHSEIRGGVGDDEDDGLLSSVVSESMGGPFLRLRTKLQAFWGLLLNARREWLLRARVPSPAVVQAASGGAVGGSSTRGPFFARRGGRGGGASTVTATRGGLATHQISSVRPSVPSPLQTVTVPSASQTPNRIPAGASREEVRLLELVDRLLDDYQRRGATPTPSQAALARVRTRQAAWDRLASSNPRALLTRYPSLNSTNDRAITNGQPAQPPQRTFNTNGVTSERRNQLTATATTTPATAQVNITSSRPPSQPRSTASPFVSTLEEFEKADEHIRRGLDAFLSRSSMTGYSAEAYTTARQISKMMDEYFKGLERRP